MEAVSTAAHGCLVNPAHSSVTTTGGCGVSTAHNRTVSGSGNTTATQCATVTFYLVDAAASGVVPSQNSGLLFNLFDCLDRQLVAGENLVTELAGMLRSWLKATYALHLVS